MAAANPPARSLVPGWRGCPQPAVSSTTLRHPSRAGAQLRQPLAEDVVAQGGEVVLARERRPVGAIRCWCCAVARAAAAAADLPIAPYALTRLATEAAPLPEPWPAAARAELIALLGAGSRGGGGFRGARPARPAEPADPGVGGGPVQGPAQSGAPVHRGPAPDRDRGAGQRAGRRGELGRTCCSSVRCCTTSARGTPGDHSVVGERLAGRIALRMGFPAADAGDRSPRWPGITCCCRTPPPGGIWTTRRRSSSWSRPSRVPASCWICCTG